MDPLWKEFQLCQEAQKKEQLWNEILLAKIKDAWLTVENNAISSEFSNVLASRFLSAIDEQCMTCEDDPGALLRYLSQEHGCHLLVALNVYSGQVTSCCHELCNLLVSLIPVVFQGDIKDIDDNKYEILPVKSDPSTIKHQLFTLSKKVIGISVSARAGCSSDDTSEILDDKGEEGELLKHEISTISNKLSNLTLDRKELFYQVLSTFLGIAQNDFMSRDPTAYLPFIEKLLQYLSRDHCVQQNIELLSYHYYYIVHVIIGLLSEVTQTKDGLGLVNGKTFLCNILDVSSLLLKDNPKLIQVFTSLNTYNLLVNFVYQNTCPGTSFNMIEALKLVNKFLDLQSYQVLINIVRALDKILSRFEDGSSPQVVNEPFVKHCMNSCDYILKIIPKICKQLRGLKGHCVESLATLKHAETSKSKLAKHSDIRGRRELPKSSANDERSSTDSNRVFPHENNSDDESAADLSDFDFFRDSSEIEVEEKCNTLTPHMELARLKSGSVCFISASSKLLLFLLTDTQHSPIQESVIRSMLHVGVCQCNDFDQYLVGIINRLQDCDENLINKILSLVTQLVGSHSTLLHSKPKSISRPSSLRQKSPKSIEFVDENCDTIDEKKKSFLFIAKLKSFLSSTDTNLKVCLLNHFKMMAHKLPNSIQKDFFTRIILQNFCCIFPTGAIKIDTNISVSVSATILKGYLEVILIYLKKNQQLTLLFFQHEGIHIMRILASHASINVSSKALEILEYLAWLPSTSSVTPHETNVKSNKSSTIKFDEISRASVTTLIQITNILFENDTEKKIMFTSNNLGLLNVLGIVEHLYQENALLREKFFECCLNYKCDKVFEELIQTSTQLYSNDPDAKADASCITESYILLLLDWLKVLLPLWLNTNNKRDSHNMIMEHLESSFLSQPIIMSHLGVQVCTAILQSATVNRRKTFHDKVNQEALNVCKKSLSTSSDEDKEHRKKTTANQEEEGYEADQESEDSELHPIPSIYFLRGNRKRSSSMVGIKSSLTSQSVPIISQAWLCVFLLRFLSKERERHTGSLEILKEINAVLSELYDYQLSAIKNNICLSQEGLLKVLMIDYSFVFEENYNPETRNLVEKIIVQLSSHKINAPELKLFLRLFKENNLSWNCLSDILLQMSQIAAKQFGPRHCLTFPAVFNSQHPKVHFKSTVHRAQTFMIHKHDQHKRYRSRSQSWSSINEGKASTLKPLGYSNQQPSLESAIVHLPLESKFTWPDKEFSLSFWYNLDDSALRRYQCDETSSNPKTFHKHRSFTLIYQRSKEVWSDYGSEELYHLCSFGALNALFEVWIGVRTGCLQYRWIVSSNGGSEAEDQFTIFDQVILPNHHTKMNKWHHLVITLMLPSQPHTAEIFTYLDGKQLPTVPMKYPNTSLCSQKKLRVLLGHGCDDENTKWKLHEHALKIGICMVFQGKHSFINRKNQPKRHQKPLVDKIKAIYLYSLGPNSSHVNTEFQEYFSNQSASHMDSSLNWDSIVFKEMSFCMSILSQELVSNKFPINLLESPIVVLADIKIELQNTLMLVYNPQSHTEFIQYIPQFKSTGQIQHVYITDTNDQSGKQPFDGNTINALLSGNVEAQCTETFQDAVCNSGGMAVLLFLHAMVSEHKSTATAQASILRVIFQTVNNCPFLLREMNDFAGYILINHTLKVSPTPIDINIMKAILESICDGDIFLATDDEQDGHDIVNKNTIAIVKNVCILQTILKDWHVLRRSSLKVQELLWSVLESLVRHNHPNVSFNIMQFQRARVVENLLMGCQEFQQESSTQLPASLCKLYIGVIENLLGQPADLPVFKAICSFLIAIHPTLDTLTLHSARNFYLIAKVVNSNHLADDFAENTHTPVRATKSLSARRTASFNEAELSNLYPLSPQVFLSQEDLLSGSIIQSEVIIHRLSMNESSMKMCEEDEADAPTHYGSLPTTAPLPIQSTKHPQPSSVTTSQTNLQVSTPNASPQITKRLKGHRRIQSDGNLKLPCDLVKLKPHPTLQSTESQDYDIISDSELPSSCEGTEEYLVVDGFIDQTVGSFTPQQVKEEAVLPKPNILFHLRLALMKLLRVTLKLLPDNLVTRVFGNIMKVEHLLALVNQPSDKLREIALENLMLYLQRGGRDCLANFNRFMGCHLLANQLHQHPITIRIMELCIGLLVSKPLILNKPMLDTLDCNDEVISPMAIVPCLTLLQSCIQKPTSFGLLIQFFIKVFNQIESLPLVACDHGLADIIGNIIYGLANESTGTMQTSWKKESFTHLLLFLDWIVMKACCTCQSLFFQMYKDLHLTLENVENRGKEKKGMTPGLLYKTCHFLKYYLIQSALNVFKTSELYINQARYSLKGEESLSPSSSNEIFGLTGASRRASAARNLMKKIRGTVQVITPPTVATPGEIQERFQEVLTEAVKLATIFNKRDPVTEFTMFGHQLNCLSNQKRKTSDDADREFSKDLLEWLFHCTQVALSNDQDNSSWATLLRITKDDVILQANRVAFHFVSPMRSIEVRLHFLKQILMYKNNKPVLQSMMLGNAVSKTRDRFFACLQSILSISRAQLSPEEVTLLDEFKQVIPRGSLPKVNDQKLLEEMREIKRRRKEEEIVKRKDAFKRISDRNADLCQTIANQGMDVSKVIVEEQDRQRQKLLRLVRGNNSKDVEVKKTWKNLIYHLTQERALWHTEESYPLSWQLDPTEGPFRMRKRLQRCHLQILPKFFLADAPAKKCLQPKHLLSYLFTEDCDGNKPMYYSFKTNDTIRFLYHCKQVTPATKNSGEVLIGETHMYFVCDDILEDRSTTQAFFGDRDVSISWRYDEIREILKRRYSLQNNALEIFLTSGRTFLLAFENLKAREEVYEQLKARELPNLVTTTTDLVTLTNRWKDGNVTNFEYLMELNKKAGRSFNDLMQYPVFPFILADYDCDILDLSEPNSYRNLLKTIACQDKSKEERYVENYNYLKTDYEHRNLNGDESATPPYHYSSHYSNSGTVLHFLVRLPPFTSMFLQYQDNQFDIPDRTFHSMSTTWKLSSFISSTDVKELIPEFFFLQEFLLNGEEFDMGLRQTKERVHDVILPKWCDGDPRLFLLIHMQALESAHVSANLHHWIDLVFGFKQTGPAAIKSTNVFHPATYFGVDVNAIKDKIHRRALQTMIETYGQTPLQLFTSAHPKRFSKQSLTPTIMDIFPSTIENKVFPKDKEVVDSMHCGLSFSSPIHSVTGLQWGNYCGSPSHPSPVTLWVENLTYTTKKIITSAYNLSAYMCGSNICVLSKSNLDQINHRIGLLTWGYNDMLLRVHSSYTNMKTTFNPMRPDDVTCCEYVPGLEILLIGGTSGVMNAWPVRFSIDGPSLSVVGAKQNLLGHDDAITSIQVCQSYSIAVTTSKDCTAIIWDLNRLCYIRSITKHETSLDCVAISNATGDVATACNAERKGMIYMWTVNAKPVGNITTDAVVNCLAFSSLPDGIAVNVIVAGMESGMIRMWDTWTLQPLRSMQATSTDEPVTSLSFSIWDPLHFFSADTTGNVYLWTNRNVTISKPPVFVQAIPNQ